MVCGEPFEKRVNCSRLTLAKKEEQKLKPISKKASLIVRKVAESKTVEALILNITHRSRLEGDLEDLAQIIYFALLQTETKKLVDLSASGELRFYIVRMIQNQYFSKNSPFSRKIRGFGERTSGITAQISETYDAEKDYYSR